MAVQTGRVRHRRLRTRLRPSAEAGQRGSARRMLGDNPSLRAAQRAIVTNWVAAYRRYVVATSAPGRRAMVRP
jgi:hypothetical protein